MKTPHPQVLRQVFSCWNWKCALMSATVRSSIYFAAMLRTGLSGSLAVVFVEILYVTLTAGIYAGLQQKSLALRPRALGNLAIVLGVPGLAQSLDWLVHQLSGAAATNKATFAVCVFTLLSALFHLHVMRNGAFLTGHGRSLADDFRRMPRLIAGFVLKPAALFAQFSANSAAAESEAA